MSLAMTHPGMILGAAAYMAPEQARGKTVDRRADIWAYGVVLFEMLTGRQLFGGGDTVTDIIAAVLTREPDWKRLPAGTPSHLRRLIERCLRKDPKLRLRDIGEARIALEEAATSEASPTPPKPAWLPWTLAGASLLALAGYALWREIRPAGSHCAAQPQPTRRSVLGHLQQRRYRHLARRVSLRRGSPRN